MKKLKSRTDWERVNNMTDDEIDFSDIPELTDEMLSKATIYTNGELLKKYKKKHVKVSLDSEVVSFFKSLGDDWEYRINEALVQFVKMKSIIT
jgi:uncharacterized protein (DUF4415 family)